LKEDIFKKQKEIEERETVKGYLFVIIKSKRYKSEALYPELFNQSQDISTDLNTNYSYAVYKKGKLINHFNNYSFPSALNENKFPGFEFTYQQNGVYNELWYNSGSGKLVLVVKRNTWILESVTLFAYLFVSFLVTIFLFQTGSFLLTNRFKWSKLKKAFQWNIRSQIQATIIFLSVFSFIVIGIATISFFIIRFNRNNEDRLSKSIQVMANEIDSLKTKGFTEKDLKNSKALFITSNYMKDESTNAIAASLGTAETLGNWKIAESLPVIINNTTQTQMTDAFRKYITGIKWNYLGIKKQAEEAADAFNIPVAQ
jgi:hypothetical protein